MIDDKLFDLVMKMDDAWFEFLDCAKEVQLSIEDVLVFMKFNKLFTELKKYAGILKKEA